MPPNDVPDLRTGNRDASPTAVGETRTRRLIDDGKVR